MARDECRVVRTPKSEKRFLAHKVVHPLCDGKRSEAHERKGVARVPVCRRWMDRCELESGFLLSQSSQRAQRERQDKLDAAGDGRGLASET